MFKIRAKYIVSEVTLNLGQREYDFPCKQEWKVSYLNFDDVILHTNNLMQSLTQWRTWSYVYIHLIENSVLYLQRGNKQGKEKDWLHFFFVFHALKSFLNGPSFRSLAASVKARNLLNPVVAAPLPSAAALVNTSSLEAIIPSEVGLVSAGGAGGLGTAGTTDVARGSGRVIPDPRLLKSSNIFCWSAFFRPCTYHIQRKTSINTVVSGQQIKLVLRYSKPQNQNATVKAELVSCLS